MAKSRVSNALADIDASVATIAAERQLTWFDRLPTDAMDTLLAAKAKFRSGEYGRTRRLALARILVDYGHEHGGKVCDPKRMSEWLAKD